MGYSLSTDEAAALANSGNIYAKNFIFNRADARLSKNVKAADPAALLANVNKLRVVARAPSRNYCRHQGRDPIACAREDASVGLLAQQVAGVIPGAVGSGASLTLVDTAKVAKDPRAHAPVLEEVKAVQGLDVHALLAQLIGSVQALTEQNRALTRRLAALESTAQQ